MRMSNLEKKTEQSQKEQQKALWKEVRRDLILDEATYEIESVDKGFECEDGVVEHWFKYKVTWSWGKDKIYEDYFRMVPPEEKLDKIFESVMTDGEVGKRYLEYQWKKEQATTNKWNAWAKDIKKRKTAEE